MTDVPPLGEDLVNQGGQSPGIALRRLVVPVAVGGLHHHIIRFGRVFRIFDQRLVTVSDIAGKYHLLRHTVFRRPDLNAGRTEQMSDIRKADFYIFIYRHFTVIIAGMRRLIAPSASSMV